MRIELVIGVAAVGLGLLAYATMPALVFTEPSPRDSLIVLAGLAGLATGLIWVIRVFRTVVPGSPPEPVTRQSGEPFVNRRRQIGRAHV